MVYLGVDYGKRKIGLAISEGLVATPLKVLEVSSLDDAINKIKSVVKAEHAQELIVGVPESGEALKITKSFVSRICKVVKVVEFEETLSSRDALEKMIKLGKGKKARSLEDAYSATLILQNYLDSLDENT